MYFSSPKIIALILTTLILPTPTLCAIFRPPRISNSGSGSDISGGNNGLGDAYIPAVGNPKNTGNKDKDGNEEENKYEVPELPGGGESNDGNGSEGINSVGGGERTTACPRTATRSGTVYCTATSTRRVAASVETAIPTVTSIPPSSGAERRGYGRSVVVMVLMLMLWEFLG